MASLAVPLSTMLIEEVRSASNKNLQQSTDNNGAVVDADRECAILGQKFEEILRQRLETVIKDIDCICACFLDKFRQNFLTDEQKSAAQDHILSLGRERFYAGEFPLTVRELSIIQSQEQARFPESMNSGVPTFIFRTLTSSSRELCIARNSENGVNRSIDIEDSVHLPVDLFESRLWQELAIFSSMILPEVCPREHLLGTQTATSVELNQFDTLKFWSQNLHNFPKLSTFAREFLAKPPSQVSVERLFSIAGHVASKRRLSLHPETLEKFVFVYMNGVKLGVL